MSINPVSLLIGLLVFGLIAYVARWALNQFPAPQPIQMIVMVIIFVIFLFWLLGELGVHGSRIRIGQYEGFLPGVAPARVVGVVLARGFRYDAPDYRVAFDYG